MSDAPPPLDPGRTAGRLADDLAAWLADLNPEDVPPPVEPAVDLFTLVGQFTALRHEVNLQTKAVRGATEAFAAARPSVDEVAAADRKLLTALIEVADALAIGHAEVEAARSRLAPPSAKWWQRLLRADAPAERQTLAGIADGYALSLRRAERALQGVGVEPIEAAGQPFDPELMEAVGLADGPPGRVVAELRKGYRHRGKLLRAAQVTVGRE